MSLFEERIAFKPFQYPWAYEAWLTQQKMHWLPEEVPMADDVQDWKNKLSPNERNLVTHIFRLFTQSDVEVSKSYHMVYMPRIKPIELQMMLASFQNMETIHAAAYSHLLDTLGLPETEYNKFLEYQAMKDKWETWQNYMDPQTDEELALSMAAFGGFTEGAQLFASFAMLLNFPRHNKLKGMGQIITWSVRDETLHCESVIKLFHALLAEKPHLNTPRLRELIETHARQVVEQEDRFIDLAFEMGDQEDLTAEDMKQYMRFIVDRRLIQLGYKGIFKVKENPLDWMDTMLNTVEHVNFFEQRGTEYAKAATQGEWGDVWDMVDSVGSDEWVVYSKDGCGLCVEAKRMLADRGIHPTVVDLTDDAERAAFYERTPGIDYMPFVTKNGRPIGGCNELDEFLAGNETYLELKPVSEWVVYSKTGCPGCVVAKRQLTQMGFEYEEVVCDEEDTRKDLYAKTGLRTMPIVMHRGHVVGSSNDLRNYLNAHREELTK
jgi:ribonucleoside-diphosphate reductase beta chain